ncbi:hypothetical protein [Cryptosporangium phraense]|uniref:DUF559 domain-containing protein n=1 Tax=Cryptosporangium phraense TaxID=2593070 RepID=A0A545AGI0_9ACTN|nr:hypothetical protein [Cryptosporangium phraense]TQS40438.1 hypothetical protein FL583_34920 [Cryptosporangium phraense]
MLAGIYASFSGPLSEMQRLQAAALHGGTCAQITGVAALRHHRLRYLPDESRVHVLVPPSTRRSSRGFVVVSTTRRLDDHARLLPAMEICSVSRAGADAARAGYPLREVRAFLAEMVQRRLTTVDALERGARLGPKRNSALLRRVIAELTDGVVSAPEAELRDLVRGSAILPAVRWNPALVAADGTALPSPDGLIEDAGLALESNSHEFHSSPRDWHRTYHRQNVLAARGVLTLHFTPRDVREDSDQVLALIEKAYLERAGSFTGVRDRWHADRARPGEPGPRSGGVSRGWFWPGR